MNGGTGNDSIVSGGANDTLTGGSGVDTLTGGAGNDKFVIHSTATHVDSTIVTDVINNFKVAGTDTLAVGAITGLATTYIPAVSAVAEVETITLGGTFQTGDIITLNNVATGAVTYTVIAADTNDLNILAAHVASTINLVVGKVGTAASIAIPDGALTITANNAGTVLTTATGSVTGIPQETVNISASGGSVSFTFEGTPHEGDVITLTNAAPTPLIHVVNAYEVSGGVHALAADIAGELNTTSGHIGIAMFYNSDPANMFRINNPTQIPTVLVTTGGMSLETISVEVTTPNVVASPSTGNFMKAGSNAANLSTILDNAKTAFADTIAKYYVGSDGSKSYVITAGDTASHYTDVIQLTGVSLSNVSATDFVA